PEYDPKFAPWATWDNVDFREGRGLVAVFDFGTALPANQLLVKVSISAVSEENALRNLDTEATAWDFYAKREAAAGAWRTALSALEIEAPAPTRKMLYTSLYHAFMGPSLFM